MSGEEKQGTVKFLTARQVAARYGLSRQFVYHNPELTAIRTKFGRRKGIRWSMEALEELERTPRAEKETGSKVVQFSEARARVKRAAEHNLKDKIGMQ